VIVCFHCFKLICISMFCGYDETQFFDGIHKVLNDTSALMSNLSGYLSNSTLKILCFWFFLFIAF